MNRIRMSRAVLLTLLFTLLFSTNLLSTGAQGVTSVQVNFQVDNTPIDSYTPDTGLGYGDRGDGQTFGWRSATTNNPVDSSGAGNGGGTRDRDGVGTLLSTLNHLQRGDCCDSGFTTEIYWEYALTDGLYEVTVMVGDAASEGTENTHHIINVEGVKAVDFVVQDGVANQHQSGTVTVQVSDGDLTLDADGGFNTKINYVEIVSADATNPFVQGTRPADGETNVSVGTSISTDSIIGTPIDETTVNSTNVYLYPTAQGDSPANHVAVSSVNASGGRDAITLTPLNELAPNTQYTFVITDGVLNEAGESMVPYEATFTTGSQVIVNPTDITFTKQDSGAQPTFAYSSLTVGPDGRLYAVTTSGAGITGGEIYAWDINADGTLSNETTLKNSTGQELFNGRTLIGIEFDPAATANNLIFWVTHNDSGFSGADNFTGGISKITFESGAWVRTDMVTGMPRSTKDHLTNSLDFGPDGALYLTQGSISAMGDRDNAWGNEPETLLSAAILRIDTTLLENYVAQNGGPLNAATGDANPNGSGEAGTNLQDQFNYGFGEIPTGFYDPAGTNAPVTVFGSGVRNAYDLAWHSNGQLYVPTNGSAGPANAPGTPNTLPPACSAQYRLDGVAYTQDAPTTTGIETQRDYLFRVVEGGYYGHPNPTRCEYVLNGGNSGSTPANTGVNKYNFGVDPDPNYQGIAYNFSYNKSPNGVIEYRSGYFGGALSGKLLVVRYSGNDDIIVLTPDPALNGDISEADTDITGFGGFADPLDLTEDPATGNIYVIEYTKQGSKITLLKPDDPNFGQGFPNIAVNDTTLIFDDVTGGSASATQSVTVSNTGTEVLNVSNVTFTGADAGEFTVDKTSFAVQPSSSTTLALAFDPSSEGPKVATLQISSDDIDTPTDLSVEVRGLGKDGLGGSDEPSLQYILDTFDYDINVGDDNPATNIINSSTQDAPLLGDEVSIQQFQKAGIGPVTLDVLAVFGPTSSNPVVAAGWYESGDESSLTELFTVTNSPSSNGQRLNPPVTGSTSFDPGDTTFGFYSRWPSFSDRLLFSEDALNTFSGNIPHHVRVYELKDSNGNVQPNAYIVATEEHISGFDYQDIVLLARNVQPVATTKLLNFNFQNEDAIVPAGYIADYGLPYGEHNGLTYGWIEEATVGDATPTPLDISADGTSGNGRDRETMSDQRYDTIIHMQYGDVNGGTGTSGSTTAAAWEIELDPGQYSIYVVLGDASTPNQQNSPESYDLSIEGIKVVDNFVPTGLAGTPTQFTEVTQTVTVGDGRLTIDAIGGSNTKIAFLEISSVGPPPPDEDAPVVQIDVTGTEQAANEYFNLATVTISADDGLTGSGIASIEYSVDGGSFQSYSAPVVFDTPGSYSVEARATDNESNIGTAGPVSFDVVEFNSGEIRVENRDWVALNAQAIPELDYLNRWMTFSRLAGSVNDHKFHDEGLLRIHNDSASDELIITAFNISDPNDFVLLGTNTLPIQIAAGDFYDLSLQFVGGSGSNSFIINETLTVVSSGGDAVVDLAGSYMPRPEGGKEIDAQEVADAFGFATDIGLPLNSQYVASEEEVLSQKWRAADPSDQIYVRQLAAFHGCCNSGVSFSLSGSGQGGFSHGSHYGQSLLPATNNNEDSIANPAHKTYNPTSNEFVIKAANYSTSNCQDSSCNNHGLRIWPLRTPSGTLVPNAYLIIQDYTQGGCGGGSANCDYNDNMYIITNIEPADAGLDDTTLTATITEDADPIAVNAPVTYGIVVENTGIFQGDATALTVAMTGFSSISEDSGLCTVSGTDVTCNIGALLGENTFTVNVTGTPTSQGTVTVSATATADNAADANASEDTNVIDPSNLPGTLTVVKEASPEGETLFDFTITGPSGFSEAPQLADTGTAAASDFDVNVNFQSPSADVPAGYLRDFGQAYGARTDADQGTGLTYGWVTPGTTTALDLSAGGSAGNGRDRGYSDNGLDQRLDTLIHMQYDDIGGTNGTPAEGAWEIEVANGSYEVTVSVGDPDVDSKPADFPTHHINIEGVTAVDQFESVGGDGALTRFTTATVEVEVNDGRLTIDAISGYNTKINYVDIVSLTEPNMVTYDADPGDYTITEIVPAQWTLDSVTCTGDDGVTAITNGVTVSVPGNGDVVCTFINSGEPVNQPPVALDDDATMNEDDESVTFNITGNDSDPDGTLNLLSVDLTPDIDTDQDQDIIFDNVGRYTYDSATGDVTFTPEVGFTGDHFIEYNIEDDDGLTSNFATITVEVIPAPGDDCSPISPENCDTVPVVVAPDLCFAFDGTGAGLVDANGIGTGFTMVMPASAPLGDQPAGDALAPSYVAELLDVSNGTLTMEATKGIFYYNLGQRTETNSQVNALGVGFDATTPVTITTTIVNPDFSPGSAQSQQAGIWFGLDEDNVIKVALVKVNDTTAKVQLQVEDAISNGLATQPVELNSSNIANIATQEVTLTLTLDPTTNTVTGFYSLDGGTTLIQIEEGGLDSLTTGTHFFSGADHDENVTTDPVSYAGLFSTKRRADANVQHLFSFADFCIESDVTDETAPVVTDDTATVDAGNSVVIDVLTNDSDDIALDTASVTIGATTAAQGTATANTDGTITYAADASATGTDTFTYTVTDTSGNVSAEATVEVTINAIVVDIPPTATDDTADVDVDSSVVIDVLTNDTAGTNPIDPTTVTIVTDPAPSNVTVDAATGDLTFNAAGLTAGDYAFDYTVADDAVPANVSNTATVTVTVNDTDCSPISPENCDTVPVVVAPDLCFAFDGTGAGLVDANGIGTGFTMVMPASAPLGDQPAGDALAPSYVAELLDVSNGTLTMEATKGIFYYNLGQRTETNSQVNALGVGFDATTPVTITTTIVNPDFSPGSAQSQQAGIWFGLDEDNVIKVALVKVNDTTAKVQLQVEDAISNGLATQPVELNSSNIANIATQEVTLTLTLDPTTNTVTGFYSLDGGTTLIQIEEGGLDSLTTGTHFFSGADHDENVTTDPVSYAGLFSTKRRADANVQHLFSFADFCIESDVTDETAPVVTDDTATVDAGNSVVIDVLTNDSDDIALDTASVTIGATTAAQGTATANTDGTITYAADASATGTDTFTYTVTDTSGNVSAEATVEVTINAIVVDTPPVAYDQSVETFEEIPVDIALATNLVEIGPMVNNVENQMTVLDGLVSDTQYPRSNNNNGSLRTEGPSSWTSGFFPGIMWYLYEYTSDPAWLARAQAQTAGLEVTKNNTGTHDVGFIMYNSFGNGLRLNGEPTNADYEAILLDAAASLATRYDDDVEAIRSWNFGSWNYPVIIDNMMNLELLMWASENEPDATTAQRYRDIAINHALTTIDAHIRADGGTYHVADFDDVTGAFLGGSTHQGFADESTWARGQAWGIYGFTMMYRETGDTRFLNAAVTLSDYMLVNLPADAIPYWDYDLPSTTGEPKDSAAATIAASAFIELSGYNVPNAAAYLATAQEMLQALTAPEYLAAPNTNNGFVLLQATGNKPSNSEVNTSLIYADYYFIEALLRLEDVQAQSVPTYTITTQPEHGTLSGVAPDLTYTPDTGYVGADSFTWTVTVNGLVSNEATVSITVDEVPVITALYREVFDNATNSNQAASTVGWALYGDTDATVILPVESGSPQGGVGNGTGNPTDLDNVIDGLPASTTSQTNGYVYIFTNDMQQYLAITEEYTVDRTDLEITEISWYQGHNNSDAQGRVAVRIDGQWYVTTQTFSNTAVSSASNFNAEAVQQVFTFSTDAADWTTLTFDPSNTMALGSPLNAPLPAGDVDAFGLYTDVSSGQLTFRFDTFEIQAETRTVIVPPVANNDPVNTVAPDETIVIDVLANDTAGDNAIDPTSVTIVENVATLDLTVDAATGAVTVDATGLTPAAYTFDYTVADVNGLASNAATVTVIVTQPVVEAPVITSIAAQENTEGDTGVSLQVEVTSQPNGQFLYTAVNLPEGLSIDPTNGLISGDVDYLEGHADETYGVIITVMDVGSPSVSNMIAFQWTILDANRAPTVVNPGNQFDTEGSGFSLVIFAQDEDDDTLTYSMTGLPMGSIDANTGIISGTFDYDSAGTYPVTVTVSDDDAQAQTTFTWQVYNTNRPPFVVTALSAINAAEGDAINLSIAANFDDPDGNTLSFAAAGLPAGLSISPTGTISGTLADDSAGSGSFMVLVSDDGTPNMSVSAIANYTITETADPNTAPVVFDISNRNNITGVAITALTINAYDLDSDPLTYSADGLPTGLTLSGNVISGTPTTAGTYNVTITVSDNLADDTTNFVWTIQDPVVENQAPVANAGADQTQVSGTDVDFQLTGTGTDSDGTIDAYEWSEGGNVLGTNATINITVQPGTSRTLELVVIDDDGARSAPDSVTLTVNAPDNQLPVADAGADQTQVSGTDVDFQLNGTGTDSDGTIDAYEWSEGGNVLGTNATINITVQPGTSRTLELVVIDDDGARSAPDSVTLTVNAPDNQLPVADAGTYATQPDTDGVPGETITLDGSASSDSDGTIASYAWTVNGTDSYTGIAPLVILGDGANTIQLIVTDDDGAASAVDTTSITVEAPQVGEEVVYRINAGRDIDIQHNGVTWFADTLFSGGKYSYLPNDISNSDNAMYESERSAGGGGFSYSLPVDPGVYTVRLHFSEIWFVGGPGRGGLGDGGERVFDVLLEGQTVLDNYDIILAAGGPLTAVTETFVNVEITDGAINLNFPPAVANNPSVAGIEVIRTGDVVIGNQTPTASISNATSQPDTDGLAGETVTLDGSASSDSDGTINSYAWTVNGTDSYTGVAPLATLNDGANTIQLIVTDDDGADSAPATMTIIVDAPAVATCGGLTQEAEAAELSGGMTIVNDALASGGQYVTTPEEIGDNYNGPNADNVTFCVDVPQAGNYQLRAFVWGMDATSDSFWVELGGLTNLYDLPSPQTFNDDWVSNRNGDDPVVVSLPAGETEIVFSLREDASRLDKIELVLVGGQGPTNQAPSVSAVASNLNSTQGETLNNVSVVIATDPDGLVVNYSATGLPTGLTMDANTGLVSGTPTVIDTFNVVVTVTDNGSPAETASTQPFNWVIEAAPLENVAPTVTAISDQVGTVGGVVTDLQVVTANDSDGQIASYSAVGLPDGLTMDTNTGLVSGTYSTAGAFNVTVTVTDDGSPVETALATFNWSVSAANQPPTMDAISDVNAIEGQAITAITLSGTDDGSITGFTVSGLPAGLTHSSGVISGTPQPGTAANSPYTVSVVATDDGGLQSAPATFQITVSEPVVQTQPPVADAGADFTLGAVSFGNREVTLDGSASIDPDGGTLTYAWDVPGVGTSTDVMPTFTLPVGDYSATLTVTDDENETAVATVNFSVVHVIAQEQIPAASGATYLRGYTELDGTPVFMDRPYNFTAVANGFTGTELIRTGNNDKQLTGDNFFTFDLNVEATVYVLFDPRHADNPPAWMSDWTNTGITFETTDGEPQGLGRIAFSQTFPAGSVTLGANEGPGIQSTMYSVIVVPNN
jgi:hypothetical protein